MKAEYEIERQIFKTFLFLVFNIKHLKKKRWVDFCLWFKGLKIEF